MIFLLLSGCQHDEAQIKVAATSVPHAEILREAKKNLKDEEVDLKIIEVDDYSIPNRLLAEKQVDANFFQHEAYLQSQKKQFGYDFRVLTEVHIEPLGIYSTKIRSLNEIPKNGRVAIPNDPTNEARALFLLERENLITLRPVELPTPLDIVSNPKKLRFEELEASLLPRSLPDVTIAVVPSNYAFFGKLTTPLAKESENSPYVNVVVVRADDHREVFEKLSKELNSNRMKKFIKDKYKGAILPVN